MLISRFFARVAVMQAIYTFLVRKKKDNMQKLLDFAFVYAGFEESIEGKKEKKMKKLKIAKYDASSLDCGYLDKEDTDLIEQMYNENIAKRMVNNEDFAHDLFWGILNNQKEIDKKIKFFLKEKDMLKIDPVTLAILYIGVYELCFEPDIVLAKQVIISECVKIARSYGKSSSYALVNAVLSKIAN